MSGGVIVSRDDIAALAEDLGLDLVEADGSDVGRVRVVVRAVENSIVKRPSPEARVVLLRGALHRRGVLGISYSVSLVDGLYRIAGSGG